jgi:hypothetical protein
MRPVQAGTRENKFTLEMRQHFIDFTLEILQKNLILYLVLLQKNCIFAA